MKMYSNQYPNENSKTFGLMKALSQDVKNAKIISILSAYYSVSFLEKIIGKIKADSRFVR